MANYNVIRADGSIIVVNDGTGLTPPAATTPDISIPLVAQNSTSYGTAVATAQVLLMENFAKTTAPADALLGQLWFDKTANTLKVNDGGDGLSAVWTVIGGAGSGSFLGLSDTPATYAGQAGLQVVVNPGETGLVFVAGAPGSWVGTAASNLNMNQFSIDIPNTVNNTLYGDLTLGNGELLGVPWAALSMEVATPAVDGLMSFIVPSASPSQNVSINLSGNGTITVPGKMVLYDTLTPPDEGRFVIEWAEPGRILEMYAEDPLLTGVSYNFKTTNGAAVVTEYVFDSEGLLLTKDPGNNSNRATRKSYVGPKRLGSFFVTVGTGGTPITLNGTSFGVSGAVWDNPNDALVVTLTQSTLSTLAADLQIQCTSADATLALTMQAVGASANTVSVTVRDSLTQIKQDSMSIYVDVWDRSA